MPTLSCKKRSSSTISDPPYLPMCAQRLYDRSWNAVGTSIQVDGPLLLKLFRYSDSEFANIPLTEGSTLSNPRKCPNIQFQFDHLLWRWCVPLLWIALRMLPSKDRFTPPSL